jgi:hypothetical protein
MEQGMKTMPSLDSVVVVVVVITSCRNCLYNLNSSKVFTILGYRNYTDYLQFDH